MTVRAVPTRNKTGDKITTYALAPALVGHTFTYAAVTVSAVTIRDKTDDKILYTTIALLGTNI